MSSMLSSSLELAPSPRVETRKSVGGWMGTGASSSSPSSSFSQSLGSVLEAELVLEIWDHIISPYNNLSSLGRIN